MPLLDNFGCDNTVTSPLHTSNPALVEPNAPYNATAVDNFFGQPLNNLNDLGVLKGGEGGDVVFAGSP